MTREEKNQLLANTPCGEFYKRRGDFARRPMWVPEYEFEANLLRRLPDQGVFAITMAVGQPESIRYGWMTKEGGPIGGSFMHIIFPSIRKHKTPGAWFIEDILAAYDAKEATE